MKKIKCVGQSLMELRLTKLDGTLYTITTYVVESQQTTYLTSFTLCDKEYGTRRVPH